MEQSRTPNTDTNPPISPYAAHIDRRLSEISALGNNWDGEGAVVPTEEVMTVMRSVLSEIEGEGTVYPALTPTKQGGLFAEWYAGPGNMIVVDVDPSGLAEVDLWEQGKYGEQRVLSGPLKDEENREKIQGYLAAYTERINTINPNWRDLFPS